MSFLLGTIPVIAAWIYSEYLEYYKNVAPPKVYVSYFFYLFVKILSRFFFFFFFTLWIAIFSHLCKVYFQNINPIQSYEVVKH